MKSSGRSLFLAASTAVPTAAFIAVFAATFAAALTASGMTLHAETEKQQLAQGLHHITIKRGTASTTKSYRVTIGTFDSQRSADETLEQLETARIPATPHYRGNRYVVSVNGLPDREAAEKTIERISRTGNSSQLSIQEYGQDITNPNGPWEIHVLEADRDSIRVEVAHAYDAAIGLETMSSLAIRRGALAAINGGYFLRRGILRGDSTGVLQIKGILLSEPDRGRAAAGFYEQDGETHMVFGRLELRGHIKVGNEEPIKLSGVNRRRGRDEIIVYTPQFHGTTLTRPDGAEIVVRNNRVVAIEAQKGSSAIPRAGFVISLGSGQAQRHLHRFEMDGKVEAVLNLVSLLPDPDEQWERTQFILGGGPLLLLNGQRVENPEEEHISRVFFLSRHPRTAVGVRKDGTMLFVTVDGRQPERSVGMSLRELSDLLIELGAVSAINLDGGGSTTMFAGDGTVNRPSDPLGERETADGILLFKR
jgi:exopolysaccharide biosynthesis protein